MKPHQTWGIPKGSKPDRKGYPEGDDRSKWWTVAEDKKERFVIDLQIGAWADRFPDKLQELWKGIRSLAQRVDEAQQEELVFAAHSFLYAIGNFKRQAPIFLRSLPMQAGADAWEAGETISLSAEFHVRRDEVKSWAPLTKIDGIGIPTATTILAALWPKQHAVFDALTVQAAVALCGAQGRWNGPVGPEVSESTEPPHFRRDTWLTWDTYEWYRQDCVLPIAIDAGVAPQRVERSLFELMKWQLRHDPACSNESWAQYGRRLRSHLSVLPPT